MEYHSNLELLSCLHHNQSKVTNLQFSGIESSIDWQTFKAQTKDLAHIERVQLWLTSKEDCDQAAVVLKRTHNLSSLDIDFSYVNLMKAGDGSNDIPTLHRLLSRVSAIDWCSQLTSLRLDNMMMPTTGRGHSRLMEVRGLKHLTLYKCYNYGPFLERLADLSLDLVSFFLEDPEDSDFGESGFNIYCDSFFGSIKSPKRISLAFAGDDDMTLNWSHFHACASTITSMKLQCYDRPPLEISGDHASDFRRFCNLASNLQQLSIFGIEIHPALCKQSGGLEPFLVSVDLIQYEDLV